MQKLSIDFFLLFFREYRNIKICFQVSVLRYFKINTFFFLLCLGRQLFILKVQAIKCALFVNKVEVINYCYFSIKGQFLLILCIITGRGTCKRPVHLNYLNYLLCTCQWETTFYSQSSLGFSRPQILKATVDLCSWVSFPSLQSTLVQFRGLETWCQYYLFVPVTGIRLTAALVSPMESL